MTIDRDIRIMDLLSNIKTFEKHFMRFYSFDINDIVLPN